MMYLFNLVSIVLGITAWIFGSFAASANDVRKSHGYSVPSFSACGISLVSQFLEIGRRSALYDYTAIEDTIRGVIIAAVVLVAVTIGLNVMAFMRREERG